MKILTVSESSTGAELGLKPGDKIESIDGSRVKDIIDYRFKISDKSAVSKFSPLEIFNNDPLPEKPCLLNDDIQIASPFLRLIFLLSMFR